MKMARRGYVDWDNLPALVHDRLEILSILLPVDTQLARQLN